MALVGLSVSAFQFPNGDDRDRLGGPGAGSGGSNTYDITYNITGAYSLPTKIKLLLINALILPIIDYASPAFSDLSKFLHLKINRLLNSALRFTYNLKRFEHISPYRRKANWLTAHNRRLYYSLSYIFYIKTFHKPSYLTDLLPTLPLHVRRTGRNIPDLYSLLSKSTTASLSNSFIYVSLQYFNRLPRTIKTSPSLDSFKHHLFNYLFNIDPLPFLLD